jgi:streptomycin 6-kinase
MSRTSSNERVAGVTSFELPANLVQELHGEHAAEFAPWVAALPAAVAELAERWSLTLDRPYQPGGQCSWVAPARDRSGRDLVLKVSWRHFEARDEAAGLAAWAGSGAVTVHAAESFDQTSALLLERCVPGTTLKKLPEPEQDVVVAGLLRRLWCAPVDGHPFRPLQEMCNQWGDSFDAATQGRPRLDPGIARAGIELFRTLPATAERSALLVTDLHAENVLQAQREPWLVIDPKPYVGDPTYDPLQHMLNCEERLFGEPVGFAHRLADLLGLDPARLLLWLFARCVQESPNDPPLGELAARLAPR